MADNNQNPLNTQNIPAVSPNTHEIPAQPVTGQIPVQLPATGQFPAAQRELLKGKPLPGKGSVVPPPKATATPEPVAEESAAPTDSVTEPSASDVKKAAPKTARPKTAKEAKAKKKAEPTKAKRAKAAPKTAAGGTVPPADADGEKGAQTDTPKKPPRPKVDPEVLRVRKEEKARATRRRNRQLIGFALAILIVVGAVSIVRGGVELVSSMLNSDEERLEYQELFEPLVWFDILPFDSVSLVDENSIKQVAIWGVLNERQDQLERNEYGEPLVPATDVEQYAARIFGPDFRFSVHASFEDPALDLRYIFNEDIQAYTAPVTGLMPRYLATVVEIQRESGGIKRVTMGYVSTLTSDDQVIAAPDYEHPAKYMDYLLRRDGSEYYLYAIENNTTHAVTPAASEPVGEAVPDLEEQFNSVISQPEAAASSEMPEDDGGSGTEASDGSDSAA